MVREISLNILAQISNILKFSSRISRIDPLFSILPHVATNVSRIYTKWYEPMRKPCVNQNACKCQGGFLLYFTYPEVKIGRLFCNLHSPKLLFFIIPYFSGFSISPNCMLKTFNFNDQLHNNDTTITYQLTHLTFLIL